NYTVDLYEQYMCEYTTCFREVKGDSTDVHSAVYDFYCLAIFSKQQINEHGLTDTLSFQTFGSTVTFSLMNHIPLSVNTIIELGTIDIHRSLPQYYNIVSELDKLLTIVTFDQ
ncbi:hypothetical protein CLU79DRAFT_703607, partial [Phycomyces nitens]